MAITGESLVDSCHIGSFHVADELACGEAEKALHIPGAAFGKKMVSNGK